MIGGWLPVAGDCSDLYAEKREAVPFLFSVYSGLTANNYQLVKREIHDFVFCHESSVRLLSLQRLP